MGISARPTCVSSPTAVARELLCAREPNNQGQFSGRSLQAARVISRTTHLQHVNSVVGVGGVLATSGGNLTQNRLTPSWRTPARVRSGDGVGAAPAGVGGVLAAAGEALRAGASGRRSSAGFGEPWRAAGAPNAAPAAANSAARV